MRLSIKKLNCTPLLKASREILNDKNKILKIDKITIDDNFEKTVYKNILDKNLGKSFCSYKHMYKGLIKDKK